MNHKNNILLALALLCLFPLYTKAGEEKHLDSLTKDIYSEKSTLYNTLYNVKHNLSSYTPITNNKTIFDIHRFTVSQKHKNLIQNLGINGTAAKFIYPNIPQEVGITSGFYVYDIYAPNFIESKYYDTKSPYIDLKITLARYGSFYTDVCASRNVNKNWNIGAKFDLLISQKEFLENTTLDASDRSVISHSLELFTSGKTSNDSYKIYVRFLILKHRVRESGGIYVKPENPLQIDETFLKREEVYLNPRDYSKHGIDVESRIRDMYPYFKSVPETVDMRQILHLYHQLEILDKVWIYHEAEAGLTTNYFEYRNREDDDKNIENRVKGNHSIQQPSLASLDKNFRNSTNRSLLNKFRLGLTGSNNVDNIISYTDCMYIKNEIGIKGQIGKYFYMPYYRIKNSTYERSSGIEKNRSLPSSYLEKKYHEHYVGIYNRYDLNILEDDFADASAEYLFKDMYRCHIGYTGHYFSFAINRTKYEPSMLAKEYHGYGRDWKNKFISPTATQAKGSITVENKWIDVSPTITFTMIENHIYFIEKKPSKEEIENEKFAIEEEDFENHLYNKKEITEDAKKEIRDSGILNKFTSTTQEINPTPISEPFQLIGKNIYIGTAGIDLNIKLGPIRWFSTIVLAKEMGKKINKIRFPTFLANTMIFYTKSNEIGNASLDTGIDMHYKSNYQADGYDPVIQQFFVQDHFTVYGYPVIDLFFNYRIDSFNMFIKWSHLNNFLQKNHGYFSTPYYPGQSMALDIGIRWSFFD